METIVFHTYNGNNSTRSIGVDKLLKLKPYTRDLFYTTLPTYEEEFEGETEDEARNREQRYERRRLDFDNECKAIQRKGALVDRIPWDEADANVKSLIHIYLSEQKPEELTIRKTHTHKWENAPNTNWFAQHHIHNPTHHHIR